MHCFRCGKSSRSGYSVLLDLDDHTVVIETAPETQAEPEIVSAVLPEDFQLLSRAKGYWPSKAREYLLGRRIGAEQLIRHRVGFSMNGKTSGRVVFPIFAEKDQLVGWSARSWFPEAIPKWLHSIGLTSAYWAKKKGDWLILTEGIFDALAVERIAGENFAVAALLGTNLTETKRIGMLSEYNGIVLWLDTDAAGIKGASKIAEELYGTVPVQIVRSAAGADPGSMTNAELTSCFEARRSWTPASLMFEMLEL